MKIRGQKVYPISVRLKRMSVIDKVTGCWNWQGILRNGYGRMTSGSRTDKTRKTISCHVASYLEFKGDIPNGLFVLHKCDNRKCINPDHLWLGTKKENSRDMVKKGRHKNAYSTTATKGE